MESFTFFLSAVIISQITVSFGGVVISENLNNSSFKVSNFSIVRVKKTGADISEVQLNPYDPLSRVVSKLWNHLFSEENGKFKVWNQNRTTTTTTRRPIHIPVMGPPLIVFNTTEIPEIESTTVTTTEAVTETSENNNPETSTNLPPDSENTTPAPEPSSTENNQQLPTQETSQPPPNQVNPQQPPQQENPLQPPHGVSPQLPEQGTNPMPPLPGTNPHQPPHNLYPQHPPPGVNPQRPPQINLPQHPFPPGYPGPGINLPPQPQPSFPGSSPQIPGFQPPQPGNGFQPVGNPPSQHQPPTQGFPPTPIKRFQIQTGADYNAQLAKIHSPFPVSLVMYNLSYYDNDKQPIIIQWPLRKILLHLRHSAPEDQDFSEEATYLQDLVLKPDINDFFIDYENSKSDTILNDLSAYPTETFENNPIIALENKPPIIATMIKQGILLTIENNPSELQHPLHLYVSPNLVILAKETATYFPGNQFKDPDFEVNKSKTQPNSRTESKSNSFDMGLLETTEDQLDDALDNSSSEEGNDHGFPGESSNESETENEDARNVKKNIPYGSRKPNPATLESTFSSNNKNASLKR